MASGSRSDDPGHIFKVKSCQDLLTDLGSGLSTEGLRMSLSIWKEQTCHKQEDWVGNGKKTCFMNLDTRYREQIAERGTQEDSSIGIEPS